MAIAKMIPRNFTGADFSALTSESYMIAVKQKISQVQKDIESWKEK
jgi:SpoVK/Ycf46/Vps4 family AAA+-type ATPase